MAGVYTMQELREKIAPIAKKHGVKRVSVFGSYGRGEATPQSDISNSPKFWKAPIFA